MDCGPTCLRMVSAYYGKHYSLGGLREKSFITREGVSILGISEAAEKLGFRSICVQVDYNKLLDKFAKEWRKYRGCAVAGTDSRILCDERRR